MYRPARLLPVAGLVAIVGILAVDHVLFWMVAPVSHALDAINAWSGGLLQPTLTGNAMRLVALGVLMFGVLRARPRDAGLVPAGVAAGVCVFVAGWVAIQLVRAAVAIAAGEGLAWSAALAAGRIAPLLGAVMAQVLGTALVEEVVHRGVLLSQVFGRIRGDSERQRLALALVVSEAFFAVNHIPMLVDRGFGPAIVLGALVALTAGGCFLAAIYLRTGNLFVAMAVHALINVSGDVIASPLDGRVLGYALGLGCILWWPRPAHSSRAST